jgi:hypothetical protein
MFQQPSIPMMVLESEGSATGTGNPFEDIFLPVGQGFIIDGLVTVLEMKMSLEFCKRRNSKQFSI